MEKAHSRARRVGDQWRCSQCGKQWDGDDVPPDCEKTVGAASPLHNVINSANLMGKNGGLIVRYEWDGVKRKFIFRFFRHGRFICSLIDEKRVIAKMERLACAK